MLTFSKPKLLQKSKLFISYLNQLFLNNDIMLSQFSLNIFNKTIFITTHLYFLAVLKIEEQSNIYNKITNNIDFFFKTQFNIFDIKTVVLKTVNLNQFIKKSAIKAICFKFKKFDSILFASRIDVFINFLHLTWLLCIKRLNIKCYLIILAKLFVNLSKRTHAKFFLFIKFLINWCINANNSLSKITGMKFVISGRLKGKPRGKRYKILGGKIPSQTIKAKIKYNFIHVYNRYGAFGLKLWLNY